MRRSNSRRDVSTTRYVMVAGLVALPVMTLGLLREGMSVTGALGYGVPIAIAIAIGGGIGMRLVVAIGSAIGIRWTARSRTHEGVSAERKMTFVRRAAVALGFAYAPGEGPLVVPNSRRDVSTRDLMVVGLGALLVATPGFLLSGMSVTGALGSGVPIAIGSASGWLLYRRAAGWLAHGAPRRSRYGSDVNQRLDQDVDELDQDVDELDQDVDELVRRIEDLEAQLAALSVSGKCGDPG